MTVGAIEFAAIVLLAGSLWHCVRYQSRAFAEQWFVAVLLYALLREVLASAALTMYTYSPQMLYVGSAPVLQVSLRASLFYLAYQFARRLTRSENFLPVGALMFGIAASFALPLQAIGAQLEWWTFRVNSGVLFGIPAAAPLTWGVGAALYYFAFWRVQKMPLPPRGKVYALVTVAPILTLADLAIALLVGI